MTEPPPRMRFQIHLSTAIVMMFVAGGIIWANTRELKVETLGLIMRRSETDPNKYISIVDGITPVRVTELVFRGTVGADAWAGKRDVEYGWPGTALIVRQEVFIIKDLNKAFPQGERINGWHTRAIIVNTFVALTILFAVCFLLEWLIRRRAARKGA